MAKGVIQGGAEMSLEEIARELGMSTGAVHMTINRAMRKLRESGLLVDMQELADALDAGRKGTVEWRR